MSRSRHKTPTKVWHKDVEPLCRIVRQKSIKRLRQRRRQLIPNGSWWKRLASDTNIDFYRGLWATRQEIEAYKRFYVYK